MVFYLKRGVIIKKRNILKKNEEFNRIISNIKPFRSKYFNIYFEKINDNKYYFGFVVSKKMGKAYIRNKIKRQLKNILNKRDYQLGFKCIIMAKKEILNCKYNEIEKNLIESLNNYDIFLK